MRLFPLLLLSLPFLLLLGLSDAAPVGPHGQCYNKAKRVEEKCPDSKPYCLLLFTLNTAMVFYEADTTHTRELISCMNSSIEEGCMPQSEANKYYCFCDSRKKSRCSREREIQDRLQAVALELYKNAHSTTLPPTTTAEPNHHRCMKGDDPLVACTGSYFCHSKIFYKRRTFHISNRTGLGCVEKLPNETLKDTCWKVESFNISNPIFECFCPSEVGRSCNALEEDMNTARRDKWDKESGAMMIELLRDETKDKEKPEKEKGSFPLAAVYCTYVGIAIVFLFSIGAIHYYHKWDLARQLRKMDKESGGGKNLGGEKDGDSGGKLEGGNKKEKVAKVKEAVKEEKGSGGGNGGEKGEKLEGGKKS